MIRARSRLQNRVDVAAAVASLAGVVERRLHLEFLNHVRIRQRHVGRLRHVVVGRADAVDQIVVVVFALTVDKELRGAAPQLRRCVQVALRSRRQCQQLLIVLCRQRQFAHRLGADRLPGRRVRRLDAGHLRRNLHLLGHRTRLERNRHPHRFGNLHLDAGRLRFRESRLIHHHRVQPRWQQRHDELTVRVRHHLARQRFRALVDDLHIRAFHGRAGRVSRDAVNRSRRASLSVRRNTGQRARHKKHGGH